MVNFFKPLLSRLVGAWVAALAVWLASRFGIVLDDNAQEQLIAGGVALAIGIGQTIYVLVHRLMDKKLNPGDAASSHLAEKEAAEVHRMKAVEQLKS